MEAIATTRYSQLPRFERTPKFVCALTTCRVRMRSRAPDPPRTDPNLAHHSVGVTRGGGVTVMPVS